MKVVTKEIDGHKMIVVETEPSSYWHPGEPLTTVEAEHLIKDLRKAIDRLRETPKKSLGEY